MPSSYPLIHHPPGTPTKAPTPCKIKSIIMALHPPFTPHLSSILNKSKRNKAATLSHLLFCLLDPQPIFYCRLNLLSRSRLCSLHRRFPGGFGCCKKSLADELAHRPTPGDAALETYTGSMRLRIAARICPTQPARKVPNWRATVVKNKISSTLQ